MKLHIKKTEIVKKERPIKIGDKLDISFPRLSAFNGKYVVISISKEIAPCGSSGFSYVLYNKDEEATLVYSTSGTMSDSILYGDNRYLALVSSMSMKETHIYEIEKVLHTIEDTKVFAEKPVSIGDELCTSRRVYTVELVAKDGSLVCAVHKNTSQSEYVGTVLIDPKDRTLIQALEPKVFLR